MYILYVDESGTINSNKPFILAGSLISFDQSKNLENALESLVAKLKHNDPKNLEIHGNHIKSGKGFWRSLEKNVRYNFIEECLTIINKHVVETFVITKDTVNSTEQLIELYKTLLQKFNEFLSAKNQNGILISDKNSYEYAIQYALRQQFSHISETPIFIDSHNSRCLQAADLVVYNIVSTHH